MTIHNLIIRNLADGRTLPITSIEESVTIGELVSAYRAELKIPFEQPLSFKRASTGKQLMSHMTIGGIPLQDNETLLVEMDIIPGGRIVPRLSFRDHTYVPDTNPAPIFVPESHNLAMLSIPIKTMHRLEETRSDQRKWSNILCGFGGVIVGIVMNEITNAALNLSKPSLFMGMTLIGITVILWVATRDYKKRADAVINEILHQPIAKID